MPRRQTTDLESSRRAAAGSTATSIASQRASTASAPAAIALAPTERNRRQAAVYARVSTDKQEREATIKSQIAALREAAEHRGYALSEADEFRDDGYSGARLDRPGLDRLRDLVADGAYDVVLVLAPDRLARQYAYQVVVIEELAQAGCRVEFLNHASGTSPEEQMLLQIQGVFAEYERALITERMRRGRLFAARQGRATWAQAPYGYTYLPKTATSPQRLVVNEIEAEIVRQMYRWLIEEALSSYAIAQRLQELGVPARKGRGWWQSTVIEVLRDPLYKGEGFYNRTGPVDAHRPKGAHGFKDQRPGNRRSCRVRPREEWIPVPVPVIIDPETWDLAQEQLQRNRLRATRHNTRHAYLLRGLAVCGHCGRRMIGSWHPTGGRYVCSARSPRFAPRHCEGRSVMAALLEEQVWEYVTGLLADPAVLRLRYEEGYADPAVQDQDEQERERIERKLEAQQREIQRLIDAYQASVIDLADLAQRRQRVEAHGHQLRERLQELQRQRTHREQEVRLLQGVEAFCASMHQALADPSFAIKQQVLQLVVDRIVVEEEQIVVHHIIPAGPFRLQTERKWNQESE